MLTAKQIRALTRGMASALLDGPWEFDPMAARLADALDRAWPWRRPLVRRLLERYDEPPAYDELTKAIPSDPAFVRAVNNRTRPHIVHWVTRSSSMTPTFPDWDLPVIDDEDELGRFLELTSSQLHWLADVERRQRWLSDSRRQHYRYRWIPKASGGWRLVEEPLFLLKMTQRQVLHGILESVVPHPAACAFRPSRSILDYASPHVDKQVVLHLDLCDFFASVPASRVHATFAKLGYSEDVARLLCGLCTSTVPMRICRQHEGGGVYSSPHLPQGAPTSPYLANLVAFRLDCRLSAAAGAVGAVYTRYADDIAFSGDAAFASQLRRFQLLVWQIIADEGFRVQHRKTRVMRRGVRQRLCGIVVNDRVNVERRQYDRLKATLTNCARHGLESQNREGHPHFLEHLRGRVVHVERIAPARGARLRSLLERVESHS